MEMKSESAEIKGKGLVTYFNFRRLYRDRNGKTKTGGFGFIHKAGCPKGCREESHTLARFNWEHAWDAGMERKEVLGKEVSFTAYEPRKDGQTPTVKTMRVIDPRFAS